MKISITNTMAWTLVLYAQIFFFSILVQHQLYAQVGVVTAPVLESQMGTQNGISTAMNATLTAMQKAEQKVRMALQKVAWAKNLDTMYRLLTVIESTVCTTQDLDINMGSVLARDNCFVSFNYDIAIVKISASIDFVNLVLMSDVLMTQGERIKTINDAILMFEESQQSLAELNATLYRMKDMLSERNAFQQAAEEMTRLSRY